MSQGLGLGAVEQRTCQSSNCFCSGLAVAWSGLCARAWPPASATPSTAPAMAEAHLCSNTFMILRLHNIWAPDCQQPLRLGRGGSRLGGAGLGFAHHLVMSSGETLERHRQAVSLPIVAGDIELGIGAGLRQRLHKAIVRNLHKAAITAAHEIVQE